MDKQEKPALGSTAETNRLLGGEYFDPTTGAQTRNFTPSVITPESLEPVKPMVIPEVRPPVEATGLLADIEASQEVTKEAQKAAQEIAPIDKTVKKQAEQAKLSLFDRIMGRTTESQATVNAYEEEGVDTSKKELDQIQNQIRSKSLAYRRQIENIQDAGGGLESGQNVEIRRIEREAARELADLSIIEQAKLDNYSTAREIADRKVKAELEEETNQIEALKFIFEENKEEFNKQEERQFNLMISERERMLEDKRADKETNTKIALDALQNGAPTSLVQQALKNGTRDGAINILSAYLRPSGSNEAPTVKEINGVDMQWNPTTGKWETIGSEGLTDELVVEKTSDDILQLDSLINNKTGIRANSGLWRRTGLINKQEATDWSADVINVMSKLTVDELGRVKSEGVTFGALSDPERKAVGDAASALNAGMIMEDGLPTGKFRISEDKVKKELETIKKYLEIDFKRRSGMSFEQYQAVQTITPEDLSELDILYGDDPDFNPAKFY